MQATGSNLPPRWFLQNLA